MKRSNGYTLIEMMIVIGILAVIMPTVFSIIYILIQQQLRIFRVSETKREGDRIAFFVKDTILREAVGIYKKNGADRCTSASTTPEQTNDGSDFLLARTKTSSATGFSFEQTGESLIFHDLNDGTSEKLHGERVRVSDFQIQCLRKSNVSNPVVGVSYTVTFYDNTPTDLEGTVSFPYHLKVKLRR